MKKPEHMVLLTRDAKGNRAWSGELKHAGIAAHSIETIQTVAIASPALAKALEAIEEFDWAVLTSASAPRMLAALPAWKKLRRSLPPAAVVGNETARAARAAGFSVRFTPKETTEAGLAREFPDAHGKRVLLLRAKGASAALPTALRKRGARIRNVALYETQSIKGVDAKTERLFAAGAVQQIIFASPSAIRGLKARLSRAGFARAQSVPVVALGPTTMKAAKRQSFKRVRLARPFTLEGIIRTLRA